MLLGGEQLLLLILVWAAIPQRLMRAFRVIPRNPSVNSYARVGETPELMLPHTFLFQRSKPTLDNSRYAIDKTAPAPHLS